MHSARNALADAERIATQCGNDAMRDAEVEVEVEVENYKPLYSPSIQRRETLRVSRETVDEPLLGSNLGADAPQAERRPA